MEETKDFKEIFLNIYKKYKKIVLMATIGIVLILIGYISWDTYFLKIKIFKEQEKKFAEEVERYYEYHKQFLPRKGESRTLTLQDLYSKKLIDDLYIPKTKKTCDVNESRVRVYQNENGEYIYNVYLKCGKFETKIDHIGPNIVLNGDDTITLAINSEYQDPGIKEVKDNKDGKIDVSKVIVDSSKVNMNKIGTYKVTYTISDSSFNKTIVERKVIVKANLTEIVTNDTLATAGYYVGYTKNNYLMYSGLLWRIIGVNSDGTIKIITANPISEVTYGKVGEEFKDSNIKTWLDEEFYPILKDTKDYVVEDATWCIDATVDPNYISDTCTNTIKSKIGLLTLSEYNKNLAIDVAANFYLLTKANEQEAYISFGKTKAVNTMSNVRPVLLLKANLFTVAGNGTEEKPYYLGDYKSARSRDLLNTRLIGEYVDYSGTLFRISGIDENKNIKLTSASVFADEKTGYSYRTKNDGIHIFDPDDEDNLGYLLNDKLLEMMDETLMIKHEYTVYTFDGDKKYNKLDKKTSFKAKISIPSSFEIFSAKQETGNYWLLDYVNDDYSYMVDYGGTIVNSDRTYPDVNSNVRWAKIVIYITKDAVIYNGNGTRTKPFHLR